MDLRQRIACVAHRQRKALPDSLARPAQKEVGYMAPEQVRGLQADAEADLTL